MEILKHNLQSLIDELIYNVQSQSRALELADLQSWSRASELAHVQSGSALWDLTLLFAENLKILE